jgi:hypothetical protein
MKTKLFQSLGVLCCFLAGCASQELKKSTPAVAVPNVVSETFKSKFQYVKRLEWKLKADGNYEAEFIHQGAEVSAKFDASGKWLETESSIPRSDVPLAVQAAAARQFRDSRIIEAQIVERGDEEKPIYELHLDTGKEIVKAQFSPGGQILNQSQKAKP